MKMIAVCGAGLVGSLIARELASDGKYEVTVYDKDIDRLKPNVGMVRRQADLLDANTVATIAKRSDVVVVAVPGWLGNHVVGVVLDMRKPVVDISFSPEDPYEHFKQSVKAGVPAIVDCGVAPGMSNLFVGMATDEMEKVDDITVMVGGLPLKRTWPFDYRLVFSLTDVIEEYTRPSRYIQNGQMIVRPALSEAEYVNLPRVGTLEAFNTDGLRTLLRTMTAPNMKEKTLRYPGHIEKMKVFREAGFFDDVNINIGGDNMNPRKLTEKLFAKHWNLPKDEDEFTVMQVEVIGKTKGLTRRIVWDLYDQTDPVTRDTSMARTTGLPAVAMARMLADYRFTQAGVWPLEELGRRNTYGDDIVSFLRSRGVSITRTES